MEELKIIENGIVPETSTGERVVYGTELHRVLGVKTAYKDWSVRRFNDVDAVENEDYEVSLKNEQNPKGGRHSLNHIIKLDTAKEMAMLERNKKSKEVRRYFIQIEKKYKIQMAGLADSIKQFMEQQTKFNKMAIERLEHMEIPRRNRDSYKRKPVLNC